MCGEVRVWRGEGVWRGECVRGECVRGEGVERRGCVER